MVTQQVPQRSVTMALAAIVLLALSLLSLAAPLFASGELPPLVVVSSIVFGVAGLVGVVGLWMRKVWGAWLAVIVSALNGLNAAPGLAAAPDTALLVGAFVTVVGALLIIVLVLLPSSRKAYT